ncbi:hypothetical protein [Iodobacter ciconiae]|uniref:Pili assembly chaperone N-terminal domain-containing protein n=1 Tax=Iodobacter ciconiae TaxID=2496266 RepID=A0A3S8ZNN8_9NEIS|nr:hypothetical protein [Iodobacter ciconiae]AZN35183.1 hypothetical protein EJO50_00975 [Iodobacter ciconiae]
MLILRVLALSLVIVPMFSFGFSVPMFIELSDKSKTTEFTIMNEDAVSHDYIIRIDETTFPRDGRKILKIKSEALVPDITIVRLPAKSQRKIKINKKSGVTQAERYFEMVVTEKNIINKSIDGYDKEVRSLLLLRPSVSVMKYVINKNKLLNSGNGSLLFMEDLNCGDKEGKTILVAPGMEIEMPVVAEGSIFSVGQQDELKEISNHCSK